ncbi:hypothetical protein [Variovorax sp. CF079]|uniref:hypothetical protein n=1 Tax=Variovorax sp. CF079 TaxID=1882774 RepID=UPI001FCD976C|nr:hypothetical protein [Variovorax sp. CF079]
MDWRIAELAHYADDIHWLDAVRARGAYKLMRRFDSRTRLGLNQASVQRIERLEFGDDVEMGTSWLRARLLAGESQAASLELARSHRVGKKPLRNREAALDNRPMTSISSRLLVDAVLSVERMTFKEREQLADEVHARQPNLFFSVLVLQRYGATLEQIEVVLNLLLVFYEAMKTSGRAWPVISEDVQERCLKRISARVRFIEGLTPQQRAQATSDAIADHPEQQLLAYVFGKFGEHGLLGIETETEKMLMLAALNLVECIAETAPRTTE